MIILNPGSTIQCLLRTAVIGCLFMASALSARVWHVAGDGDDSRDGNSPRSAFRSLQRAADVAEPGDTVLVGDGVYTDSGDPRAEGSSLVTLSKFGRPDAWITFKAAPRATPELRPKAWNGIYITGAYYIIDGLRVTGANDSIRLIDALADALKKDPNPYYNTNGILIEGRKSPPDRKPHHIVVRNCIVSKCPGGGISALAADYLFFEDNLVFENAWYMRYGGSGITTNINWAHDDAPGYHTIIRGNRVWNNKTLVPWEAIGKLSDGNGILLDVTDDEEGGAANPNVDFSAKPSDTPVVAAANKAGRRPIWKNRALIANNVSAYNGGSGIHVFRTRYVDIINNTTYWNGQVVNYEELFSNNSRDIVILNNIIVPAPGGRVTSNHRNTDVRWDYNLYPDAQKALAGERDIVATPEFIKVARDLREADFRLKRGSAGLDVGTDEVAQATDLEGKKRPAGRARDRGAFEQ